MKLDIFSEMQRAQPWARAAEATLIQNAIEQAVLADKLGYDCWWSVEHHGAGEFSLSSTPEMFNLAVALSTKRLRIGHAGVLAPFGINHPIRVAERAAFLDLMSNGRLEMGMARSSAGEWGTFSIEKDVTQPQFDELSRMLPAMWGPGPFSWNSNLIEIPEINIVPKPAQDRPPMWCMGMSADGARTAGRLGLGFIGTTVMEPIEKTLRLRAEFQRAGAAVSASGNAAQSNFGLFTFVHCAENRDQAITSRAAEAAMWYVNHAPQALKFPREALLNVIRQAGGEPNVSWRQAVVADADAGGDACDPNDPHPVIRLLNRQFLNMPIDAEEAYETLIAVDSVIIGEPELCHAKMKLFAEGGVDRLLCLQQFGQLAHSQVCSSIRLIGEQILPYID